VTPPEDFQVFSCNESSTIFPVAPETWWISSDDRGILQQVLDGNQGSELYLADMRHAWVRIRLGGSNSSMLLMRGVGVDLSDYSLPQNGFVKSDIHGMPLLIHKLVSALADTQPDSGSDFDNYVSRSYATSFREWVDLHAWAFSHSC